MTLSTTVDRRLAEVPPERREQLERQLLWLIDELAQIDQEGSELELENLALRAQLHEEVRAESIGAGSLRQLLGVSRERVRQLRESDHLLGFRLPGGWEYRYPLWQLDSEGRPLRVMPELLAAVREARLDPLDLHLMMVAEREDEPPLLERLQRGELDLVLGAVRAAGDIGA